MPQYIDKTAIKAEIERLDEFWHLSKSASGQAFIESLLSFLNTLEVKEVEEVEERTQHQIPMEDIENAAARYDGSMNCVGCFIGGAKWMEQRLKDK